MCPSEKSFIEINRAEQPKAEIYFPSFISSLLLGTFQDFFPRDFKTLLLRTGAAWGMTAAMHESSWE